MASQGRFQGRVAVVTGAADGMGREIALQFLAEGAHVVAADRDAEKLREALGRGGERVRLLGLDVTAPEAAETLIDGAAEAFGRLDILVNAAGICDYEPFETMSDANWHRTIAVNLTSVFALCRQAIPHLRRSGEGRIVNVSSVGAVRSEAGSVAYAVSKSGTESLTRTLAVELGADRITANYVRPGAILTGMTRELAADPAGLAFMEGLGVLGRMGTTGDVASAVLFLASPQAGFVTGQGLTVDGGCLVKI